MPREDPLGKQKEENIEGKEREEEEKDLIYKNKIVFYD